MIVLDTTVLSEALRPALETCVLAWLEAQPRASLFTTAVTRGELLYGIRLLPDGQRRQGLLQVTLGVFDEDFSGLVLPFDAAAADAYAQIAAFRRAAGRPISQFDAMIAAITRSRGGTLATRNVKDFEGCGIGVVSPWAAA